MLHSVWYSHHEHGEVILQMTYDHELNVRQGKRRHVNVKNARRNDGNNLRQGSPHKQAKFDLQRKKHRDPEEPQLDEVPQMMVHGRRLLPFSELVEGSLQTQEPLEERQGSANPPQREDGGQQLTRHD